MAKTEFEVMEPGPDGWTEWASPVPGYQMKCCDCGLTHVAEFRVVKIVVRHDDGTWEAEWIDDPNYRVQFRMRR
jgi:hypothetical protein